jgi:hypothetical protein
MLRTGQIDVDMFAKGVTTLVAETSGAIVTIHGTRYILSCEKTSGQTVVEVKSGKVQVDTLMGEQHFLKAGMKITVDAAGTLLADNCKKVKEISQAVNVVKEKTLEVCLTKEPKTSGEVAVTQKPTVNLEKPVVENPKNTTSVSVAPLTAPSIIEMPVETTKDTQETKVEVKSVETLMDRLKNGNIR